MLPLSGTRKLLRGITGVLLAVGQLVLVRLISPFAREVIFRVDVKANQRVVALTIDDGPSPLTDPLLRILERHNAHATFFLLGRNVEAEDEEGADSVLQRIVGAEHEIANHTWDDRSLFWSSRGEIKNDLARTHALLIPVGRVALFRPGGAWFRRKMLRAAAEVSSSYRCALGSIYPHDVRVPWPRFIVWYIRRFTRPGDIIVLHEGVPEQREQVIAILDQVLKDFAAREYSVTTLSGLTDLTPAAR